MGWHGVGADSVSLPRKSHMRFPWSLPGFTVHRDIWYTIIPYDAVEHRHHPVPNPDYGMCVEPCQWTGSAAPGAGVAVLPRDLAFRQPDRDHVARE